MKIKTQKMKKTLQTKNSKGVVWFKIFIVFLLIIIVSSCDLIPAPEPDPEPKPEPTPIVEVNAYALPESIQYASSTMVHWTSKNVTSVTINDVPVSINGSKSLNALTKDTTLILKFLVYNGDTIERIVSIKVAEPIVIVPTKTDTVTGRYWMLTKDSKYLDEGIWRTPNLDEDELSRKMFFYKNGNYEVFKKDGNRVGNGKWNWVGSDSIKIGGPTYEYQLTDTTFIRSERGGTIIDVYKGFLIPKPL